MDQIIPEAGLDMVACLERVRQFDEEAARALCGELYPLVIKNRALPFAAADG